MLLKIVYLLVRRVLSLTALMFRRDLAKDAELFVLRTAQSRWHAHCTTCGIMEVTWRRRYGCMAGGQEAAGSIQRQG